MKYKYIIAIDPSGSFNEGKGTTGYSIFFAPDNKFIDKGIIDSKSYPCPEAYWEGHIRLLQKTLFNKRAKSKDKANNTIVVIEDYLLYADKAQAQINSRMETSKLIGILQHWCYTHDIPYYMQTASLVKNRWTDEILQYKKYLKRNGTRWEVCIHTRDSMRHAVHFATFKNGDD